MHLIHARMHLINAPRNIDTLPIVLVCVVLKLVRLSQCMSLYGSIPNRHNDGSNKILHNAISTFLVQNLALI